MVTVAIVGAGGMGKTHLGNLANMQEVVVDSICDPSPAASALASELHAAYYVTVEEMLANTAATIVLVCTPTFLHAGQIEAVLRSGRHCISEKPLCLSSAQAKALFALAQEMGVHLYVAQVLHFTEQYMKLQEIVDSGEYGRVLDAFFYRLSEKPKWTAGNWLFDPQKSGLIPYDLHIHELDYIVGLFGKPLKAQRQQPVGGGQCDHYRFLYTYENLTVCTEASWYNAPIPFTDGFRLYFEQAVVVCEGGKMTVYKAGETTGQLLLDSTKNASSTAINVSSSLPYLCEVEHFLQCAAENRASDIVKNENVIAVLETLETMCGTDK